MSSGETFNPGGTDVNFQNMGQQLVIGAGTKAEGGRGFHGDTMKVGPIKDLLVGEGNLDASKDGDDTSEVESKLGCRSERTSSEGNIVDWRSHTSG